MLQARSQTFLWGGQIGQILGPFMITRGLSCDRVEFGHLGGGQMTPLTSPWLRACSSYPKIKRPI